MIRFFAILICLALNSLLAQGKPTQEKEKEVTQHNFLFIIDSSLSMAPRKAAMVQMVRGMIASGFDKQIQSGDSVDIWTYDEQNRISGFPPQIWEAAEAKRIADDAGQFVDRLEFNGRSHFELVAHDLEALLPNSKRLLIVLITDGNELLSGIPLDLDLNEFVANEKRRRPDPKQPFLISIAAVSGKYIQWSAYCDESDRVLASLPPRETPQSKPQPKSQPQVAAAKPKETKEPEKKPERKKEEIPMFFELPPGARLAAPPPAPKVEAPAPTVAPKLATNLATTVAHAETHQGAKPPVTPEEKKQSEPPRVVATAGPAVTPAPAITTSPTPLAPPPVQPTVQPQAQALNQQPATQPMQPVLIPVQKAEPKPTPPVQVANFAPVLATNHVQPPSQAQNPQPSDSNTVAVAAAPPVSPQPRPLQPPLPETISFGAIFGGLTLTGFAIIILAGLLLLKKGAKARQGGSIISRSLQL